MNIKTGIDLICKLIDIETEIINNIDDDEACHILEKLALVNTVKNMHFLDIDETLKAQEIIKRIEELDFSRWFA